MTHFGDEFRSTADILKKYRDIPKFEAFDSNDKPISMKSIQDLRAYLQAEIDAYQAALDEME